MRIFRRILTGLHSFIGRRLYGQSEPQVIPPELDYMVPSSMSLNEEQANQAGWADDLNEADAIRRHYVPNQSDSRLLNIREFPVNGSIPTRSEHFIFDNDGMQHFDERTASILAGNELGSPNEVGGFCVCGRPVRAIRIRPCHICGACLCRSCGRVQPLPPGAMDVPVSALVLCPSHLLEFREQWRHWGTGCSNGPVFLPPHYSIAMLDYLSGVTS